MKIMPDTTLRYSNGIRVVIQDPAAIASPSTIKNESITPINIWTCLLDLEERTRIESCVLSPISAIAIVSNGIIMSSINMIIPRSFFLVNK